MSPIGGIPQEKLIGYLKEQMGLTGEWTLKDLEQRWFNSGAWINPDDELGLISAATNRTGTPTLSGTAVVWIPGMTIMVPPTRRNVQIQWEAHFDVSVAGQGSGSTVLYETTGGVAVPRGQIRTHTGAGAGTTTANFATHMGHKTVGPSKITRVFSLYTLLTREAASAFQCRITNKDLDYDHTRLEAVAF